MTAKETALAIKEKMKLTVSGKDDIIDKMLICLFCLGNILLEDIPGTGKTTMARALASAVDAEFSRIQFTADLLPSDITGIKFFNQKENEFVFRKGGLFANIVLADEINRAAPRTQSALLECMEEHQVTADGETYPLPEPFMVIATENPIETRGTFPLPEAQLDRFLIRLTPGYPDRESELEMMLRRRSAYAPESTGAAVSAEDILAARKEVLSVTVSSDCADYILRLAEASRSSGDIVMGISPRGCIAVMRAAQGKAAVSGRDFITPDDVKYVFSDVCAHRIISKDPFGKMSGEKLCEAILNGTAVPREGLSR